VWWERRKRVVKSRIQNGKMFKKSATPGGKIKAQLGKKPVFREKARSSKVGKEQPGGRSEKGRRRRAGLPEQKKHKNTGEPTTGKDRGGWL